MPDLQPPTRPVFPRPPPPPKFSFDADPSLAEWQTSARTWLTTHDKSWNGLAGSCLVFNPAGRVLLLQRAAHDSMPNLYEVPGGGVDDADPTVLHGAARELWEEAGLVARRFARVVTEGPTRAPGYVFANRTGKRFYCRFSFEVEVVDVGTVTIDLNEHQRFVWASEAEVRAQKMGDLPIPMTNAEMRNLLLEGFRLRREAGLKTSEEGGDDQDGPSTVL